MSLINRIEVSSMLPDRGQTFFEPMLFHNCFNLRGRSSVIQMPNGMGKSTITEALLGLLGRNRKLIETTKTKMAPKSYGYYSHFRVEVVSQNGNLGQGDILGAIGADVYGEKHVFGMYANTGEGQQIRYYTYFGTIEECPIVIMEGKLRKTLIEDSAFLESLKVKKCKRDLTEEEWLIEVSKHFVPSDIEQMIAYQKAGAGDSTAPFYEVKEKHGESFESAFFYTHLAPQLLVAVMGAEGEHDEERFEHTLYISTKEIMKAKLRSEQEEKIVEGMKARYEALEEVRKTASELSATRKEYEELCKEFVATAEVLKDITVRNPLPGIPSNRLPEDEKAARISSGMVLQNGQWYVMDRVLAEISGEQVSQTNERAKFKKISNEEMTHSQLIEVTVDLKIERDHRGKPSRLYSKDSAVSLISLAPHFSETWSKEVAISSVNKVFEWAESTADTNFIRREIKHLTSQIELLDGKIISIKETITVKGEESKKLEDKRIEIRDAQSEYRKMEEGQLFSTEEMQNPKKTGEKVKEQIAEAEKALDDHRKLCAEMRHGHSKWLEFIEQYGKERRPDEVIERITSFIQEAKSRLDTAQKALHELNDSRNRKQNGLTRLNTDYHKCEKEIDKIESLLSFVNGFREIFGDIHPSGLEDDVRKNYESAESWLKKLEKEINFMSGNLNALRVFREKHNEITPGEWVKDSISRYGNANEEKKRLKDLLVDLKRRRSELDRAQVASGEVYSKALAVAGNEAQPLYQVVESFGLAPDRVSKILTLFSSFLFAAVYDTVEEAARGAQALHQAKIETPVFVKSELKKFCENGEVSFNNGTAYTYFVGIRTRPVDCLLNPNLVEEEKNELDHEIERMESKIIEVGELINELSPTTDIFITAQKAETAVRDQLEEKEAIALSEVERINKDLPDLKKRYEAIHLISHTMSFYAMGGDEKYGKLCSERETAKQVMSSVEKEIEGLSEEIGNANIRVEESRSAYSKAMDRKTEVDFIRAVDKFLNVDNGISFIATAEQEEKNLDKIMGEARKRIGFNFLLAHKIVEYGIAAAREIEKKAGELSEEIIKLREEEGQSAELRNKYRTSREQLLVPASSLDGVAASLLKKYKKSREIISFLPPVQPGREGNKDDLLARLIEAARRTVASADASIKDKLAALEQVRSAVETLSLEGDETGIKSYSKKVKEGTVSHHKQISRVVADSSLEFNEFERKVLEGSKDDPTRLESICDDIEKDLLKKEEVLGKTKEALDNSWNNLDIRMLNLITRLKANFDLLRKTLKWREDNGDIHAGFEINATPRNLEDAREIIKAIIEDIGRTERRAEEDRQAGREVAGYDGKEKIYPSIKDRFYRYMFSNPEIKVRHPEFGRGRALPYTRDISSGQKIAFALLWMIKLADFAIAREIEREPMSYAQKKKVRATAERVMIVDGIFSNLSEPRLIKESLRSISKISGKFQLIGLFHNPSYPGDSKIFPTHIIGHRVYPPGKPGGIVFLTDGKMVHPETVGRKEGQVETIELHVDRIE